MKSQYTRRDAIRLGGMAATAAAVAVSADALSAQVASAHPGKGRDKRDHAPRIVDYGPAVEQFALMSGLQVGDTLYIGTRNVEPAHVIGFHLPTGKVTVRTELTTGYSVQALAADASGRYLYIGVLQKEGGPQANLHRWDLSAPEQPAVPIGRTGERDVRDITVAPDGVLYAVGGTGSAVAPALWEYDPAVGTVVSRGVPDTNSTLARAVAATDKTVFFGGGSTLGGGGGAGRATLFAYDRASGSWSSVIPSEMTSDPSMRELAIVGDTLIAGTAAATENAKIAIMQLADLTSYKLATTPGAFSKMYAFDGDTMYYSVAAGLESLSLTTAKVTPIPATLDLGEVWGVSVHGGKVLAVSGYGFVASVDPVSGAADISDLPAAGAPVSAQTVMGIAAGGGYVYVGGNGSIVRRRIDGRGKPVAIRMPGEAKDAEVLGGVLYTGQYNAQGIWRYSPRTGKAAQAASFPKEQNRPLDTAWDSRNRLLLVAVQSDTEGGGALWTFDPRREKSRYIANPIDDIQLVRAVAVRKGIAYLGGDNAQRTGARGTIVAYDPHARRELWRIESGQAYGIGSLAVVGNHLFGMALKGGFFVVDLRTRRIVHTENLTEVCPQWSAMQVSRGRVYIASDTTLLRVDPRTFEVSVVVADLKGSWYSGSHVQVDELGRLYTMRGSNLIRVDDRH